MVTVGRRLIVSRRCQWREFFLGVCSPGFNPPPPRALPSLVVSVEALRSSGFYMGVVSPIGGLVGR